MAAIHVPTQATASIINGILGRLDEALWISVETKDIQYRVRNTHSFIKVIQKDA